MANTIKQKHAAQDLIMRQLSLIGYGEKYEEYCDMFNTQEEADECLIKQMDRVAKLMGYDKAWFG